MPLYTWVTLLDNGSELEVTILRNYEEYEIPPTEEEIRDTFKDEESVKMAMRKDRTWRRKIGSPTVNKVPGWGQKGYW